MKLWLLSDLHLEHSGLGELEIPDADICIVAGDVQTYGIVASLQWLDKHVARYMPTIFVAGNHEWYRAERGFLDEIMHAKGYEGSGRIHFLERNSIQIQGITFLGATLWSDFDVLGLEWTELAIRNAAISMNDYRLIKFEKSPYQVLKPVHTYRMHMLSRNFLRGAMAAHFQSRIVVVTHHAPSLRSVEEKYLKDLLTPSFASNLENLMRPSRPELWIHGHVHHHVDYELNGTRVVAHPRGYPGEACHKNYDFKFVIEI